TNFDVVSGPGSIDHAVNILSFSDTGVVSVVASQAGDANWNAAIPATNLVVVSVRRISGGLVPGPYVWTNLGAGVGGLVRALAVDTNGDLYAGGEFTNAGGVAANRIAKWDGTNWSALGIGVDNSVRALACDSGSALYAGGLFTTAGGSAASKVAKWDEAGSGWTNLRARIDGGNSPGIHSLAAAPNGSLYAGGTFTTPGNRIAKWNGAIWSDLGAGIDDDNIVYTATVGTNGDLYVGGTFTKAGGQWAGYVAKWNGANWSALSAGVGGTVDALAFDASGYLYAGGRFTEAGWTSAGRIAKWNGKTWVALGAGLNNAARALAVDLNGNLYAGGEFTV
ncbi:MAG: hypothetical protein Q8O57_00090, partial [Kiritimatiellota bacterium]|nr:hypothetical protein [Kiritimatiellota bacterium]